MHALISFKLVKNKIKTREKKTKKMNVGVSSFSSEVLRKSHNKRINGERRWK